MLTEIKMLNEEEPISDRFFRTIFSEKKLNTYPNPVDCVELSDYVIDLKKTLDSLHIKCDNDSSIGKYSYEVIQYFKATRGIYIKLSEKSNEIFNNILLSAFLATFLFKNDNMIYYKNNGITLENCLEVLELSKENMLDFSNMSYENSNISSILDYLKTVVGLKLKSGITINDIANMIIDINKTENYAIEELVCRINPTITINSDFKKQVNDYVTNFKIKYFNDKMQSIFGNVTKESIDFIVYAFRIYFDISDKYDNDERTKLSILLAAINSNGFIDNKYKAFLGKIVYEITGVRETYISPNIRTIDFISIEKIYKGFIPQLSNRQTTPDDIIKNIYGSQIDFEKAFNDFENEEINTIIKKIKEYKCGEYILNSYRIMKCLDKALYRGELSQSFLFGEETIQLSLFIGLYSCNNFLREYLEDMGIDYSVVCKTFKLNSCEINKYENIPFEKDLMDYYDKIIKTRKKSDSIEIAFECFCRIIQNIMKQLGLTMDDFKEICEEISQKEKLMIYSEIPVEAINIKSANSIAKYGKSLEPLVEEINNATSKLSEKPIDSEQVDLIRDGLNSMTRKRNFLENIFKGNTSSINLDVLDNLKKFLDSQIIKFVEENKKFTYVKRLIALYIYKVEQLINVLKNELNDLEKVKCDDMTSSTYMIQQQETELKKQLLEVKINDFNTAIIVMMDNYKKMCLLETTHAAYISNMNVSRTTVIPSLYTNLSVSNGLINQRNVSEAIGFINEMLTNMTSLNTDGLIKSLENVSSNTQLINFMPEELKSEIARLTSDDKSKVKTIQ